MSLSGARQYFIKKSRNTLSIDIHTRVPKGRKHPDRAAFCTMLLQQRFAKTHEPSSPNQQRSETNSPGQLLPRQTTTQHLIRLDSTVFASTKQTQRTAYITKPRKASRHTLQRILGSVPQRPGPRQRMRMLVVFGKGVKAKPTPLLWPPACGDLEKKRIKAGAERFHLAGIRLRLHIFGGINTQPALFSPPNTKHSDPGRK